MSVSAGDAGSCDGSLSNYVLSERPGCVVQFGKPQIKLHWPDSDAAPPVLYFSSLSEYSDGDMIGPVVAILQLDDQIDSLDQVLGLAVRMFPARLLVCFVSRVAPDQTFFAFGFKRINVVDPVVASSHTHWFEYRLSNYKQLPEWLNAQFWANPQRFDADDEIDVYGDDDEE